MAITSKRRGRIWSRFHFLIRILGLTGLVAAGVGLFVLVVYLGVLSITEWPTQQTIQDIRAALEAQWSALPVWSGAQAALDRLAGRTKLAVVTNCSARLGRIAAARLKTNWDAVITAEEAGFYKPHPQPYRLALARVGVAAQDAAFVAGSGYDLVGTAAVGLRTYWHNRIGLARPADAPPAALETRTLDDLVPWLEGSL